MDATPAYKEGTSPESLRKLLCSDSVLSVTQTELANDSSVWSRYRCRSSWSDGLKPECLVGKLAHSRALVDQAVGKFDS